MQDWPNQTVLAVDDSQVQRSHMVDMLRAVGFGRVLEAMDGVDALRVLEANGPVFLVLSDLEMPGMDGIELIRHLTERRLTQYLIVASARDPRLLEIVESMGAEEAAIGLLGTLVKPIQREPLDQLLDRIGHTRLTRALALEKNAPTLAEIEKGLEAGEFVAYMQPKVSMHSGYIKGCEALARWQHPQHGLMLPQHFIPALEGTPLMAPFTLAIVRQVLEQLLSWMEAGLPPISVSVNLSADNLADRAFVDRLAVLVKDYGMPASALTWEVTETMVMKNLSQALANLGRLRLMGFGLAMDDFGIGYSSMQQLSRCPFTELKIDRVFVDGAAQRSNRGVILESSIELGRRLGVTTVAEGVESQDDWRLLRELGCDLAQGYLVAKPMPAGELPNWIRTERGRLRALATRDDDAAHGQR